MDTLYLTIAGHHINLMKVLKDHSTRHYILEVAKIVVPVFVTGLITFLVTRSVDDRNKKRWLNDGYLKRKIELEIQIRQVLLNIKRELDKLSAIENIDEIKENLPVCFCNADSLNPGSLLVSTQLKSEFALDYIVDEYLVFNKNNKTIRDFVDLYANFLELVKNVSKFEGNILDYILQFKQETEYTIEDFEKNFKMFNKHWWQFWK